MWRFLRYAMPLALAGCSPAGVLNALTPDGGVRVERDVRYAPGPRHTMDVYRPVAPGDWPVLVFFYGGDWRSGRKGIYPFVANTLARKGAVVVVPDYRLYPAVQFPDFLRDCAAAAAYVEARPAEFGSRMFLIGHSAGAYNAIMLALDRRYLQAAGGSADRLAGAIGLAGPYDFLPMTRPDTRQVFGAAAESPTTQPVDYARKDAPPLLLLAGKDDATVQPRNTQALAARMAEAGGRATAILYPGLGHVGLLLAIAPVFQWRGPVLQDIAGFVATHAAPQAQLAPDRRPNGWPGAAGHATSRLPEEPSN